jgi:transcriptional regulator with XRE-family HTH domain
MMLLRHAIGSALRRLRLNRGLTLRQLSDASRVSLPYLSEVERGRKEASSEILSTICIVLGLSVADLLRETDAEFARAEPAVLDIRSRMRDDADDELHEISLSPRTTAGGQTLLLAA